MNTRTSTRIMTALVLVLVMLATVSIAFLVSEPASRDSFFQMAVGFLVWAELLAGLSFIDITESGRQKSMPFKVGQGVVSTGYLLFALGMALMVREFSSVAAYGVLHTLAALAVVALTVAFALVQYSRRDSDVAETAARLPRTEMRSLLGEVIDKMKLLQFQDILKQPLTGLSRAFDSIRYSAETLPGAEKYDDEILQHIEGVRKSVAGWNEAPEADRKTTALKIEGDARKLEQLLKRREAIIKELR